MNLSKLNVLNLCFKNKDNYYSSYDIVEVICGNKDTTNERIARSILETLFKSKILLKLDVTNKKGYYYQWNPEMNIILELREEK